MVEFGEWLCTQVLKLVPRHQLVFSLPKRLRIYFLFGRKLLAKLSRCAWKLLSTYLKQAAPFDYAMLGAAIAVHTFADFQQFNPHLHIIATDGCFSGGGTFTKGPGLAANDLEELFRYEVLKILRAESKLNNAIIEKMMQWQRKKPVYCCTICRLFMCSVKGKSLVSNFVGNT